MTMSRGVWSVCYFASRLPNPKLTVHLLKRIELRLTAHFRLLTVLYHLEKHNILTDANHGFRCKILCDTQLTATIQEMARGRLEGSDMLFFGLHCVLV